MVTTKMVYNVGCPQGVYDGSSECGYYVGGAEIGVAYRRHGETIPDCFLRVGHRSMQYVMSAPWRMKAMDRLWQETCD